MRLKFICNFSISIFTDRRGRMQLRPTSRVGKYGGYVSYNLSIIRHRFKNYGGEIFLHCPKSSKNRLSKNY